VFRLPTNSILDLHTLTLKCAGQIIYCGSNTAGVYVQFPRFTQSMFRRKDWTMGGMQTGCGSLHDYGAPYSLLGAHKIPINRFSADLDVTDNGNYIAFQRPPVPPNPGAFLLKLATTALPLQNTTPWVPFSLLVGHCFWKLHGRITCLLGKFKTANFPRRANAQSSLAFAASSSQSKKPRLRSFLLLSLHLARHLPSSILTLIYLLLLIFPLFHALLLLSTTLRLLVSLLLSIWSASLSLAVTPSNRLANGRFGCVMYT